jgi:hypothetical protein
MTQLRVPTILKPVIARGLGLAEDVSDAEFISAVQAHYASNSKQAGGADDSYDPTWLSRSERLELLAIERRQAQARS